VTSPAVPEPSTWAMMLLGFASLALLWQFRFAWVDEEFLTVWASLRSRPFKEVEDGLPDRRHARLWRRSADSFFSVPLL
jgi:PEP-CTERM motif